ncbi:hypothetical protein HAX54_046195 [Datura stramonium]|uniref:Uncharacterized protein n=1 Tax=Datura stramonium TaxID=4076 RepID=A0ABS8WKE8_DATST|nr:hypothetical protein [Datura stramonium]
MCKHKAPSSHWKCTRIKDTQGGNWQLTGETPTPLSKPSMARRFYPVHLGIQSQSVTHPTKRCCKARIIGMLPISTSVHGSSPNIGLSPDKMLESLHNVLFISVLCFKTGVLPVGAPADQYERRAKQQAISLPYPSLVSTLCVWDSCPLFWSLDKTGRADNIITFATKTDKDSPAMKRAKGIENRTLPPPSVPSNMPAGQFQVVAVPTTTPPDLLKLAQMA